MRSSTSSLIAFLAATGGLSYPSQPNPINPIRQIKQIQLGPRPYFLVDKMSDGPLKTDLLSCQDLDMKPSTWSIGHRGGAPLQFPEHSRESNLAGARMGAGTLECDVAFTKDLELVCRHSQCDLHTTTNIVTVPELNSKCTQPFRPAADGKPASANCCTSDITLAEFKTLCAKMDGFNASATNAEDYLKGTPSWRTDLYAKCGTVMEHSEHIALVEALGLRHSPELKQPMVPMPFQGEYTKEMYAQQLIDNYKKAGVPASRVLAQTFEYDVALYWLKLDPDFGRNTILLDESGDTPETYDGAVANLTEYAEAGVQIVAPPLYYLVESQNGSIVPSKYAKRAKELGLNIITWSLERSGPLAGVHANGDYFYTSIKDIVTGDGDLYELVDVLYKQVGVVGMFSDWSATTTFYATCFRVGVQ
ncbi:glycerophosphoryl diester phosphodiesterase family protein [Hirsutella rhossiliensis]|uniref:glycerophosphodiester phosphodiesterase n=1 Tax=Hirsutella rhossiliensis TaxID=111463 RepID=A0A9P8N2T3_9HYPO|nr:glycerophosphoryl diester phosphodiesterase family domain-containing protein [Hirsutella rhossiliensis]KAH0964916.1 glycerophosphoryl diester phosphodiesterase family domain-containing protein [Hirsutella rhossiliensis]